MERTERLQRVGILCCHFATNYAYYKAGFENGSFKVKDKFWACLNGNFIDISVLEWCKLFGDYKNDHHWKKVMSHDPSFKDRMFEELKIAQTDLDQIHRNIKSYRDKFVAHLDSEEIMHIPWLKDALRMVCFYYSEVRKICDSTADWPESLEVFHEEKFNNALIQYNQKT